MVVLSFLIAPFRRVAVGALILVSAAVLVAHVSLETLLADYLEALPGPTGAFLESSLLIAVLYSALHLLLYRPMALRIGALEQTAEALRAGEEHYRRIVETANEGVWVIDAESKTVFVNAKMAAMLGYAVDEMLEQPVFAYMGAENESMLRRMRQRRRRGVAEQYELQLLRKDGTALWTLVSAAPRYDTGGRYAGGLAMVTDISACKRADEALRASEERYRGLAEASLDIIFVIDRAGFLRYINTFGARMHGARPSEIVGRHLEDLFPPAVADRQECILRKVFEGGEPVSDEMTVPFRDREIRVSAWLVPLKDGDGEVSAVMGIARDITERKRLEEELAYRYNEARHLADHDPVTGLLNHRAIHARLEQEVQRAGRNDRPLSVMVMDLDGFKLFNDTYGHPAGDTVLQGIAAIMKGNAREFDLLGRYGGDEFTAILPDTDAEGALALAERFRAGLREHPYRVADGPPIPLHMSFGVATCPKDGCEPHELIGCADANLYESKQRGGDTITSSETSSTMGDVKLSAFGVLDVLVTAVDRKDHYTRTHSEQVADYIVAIAQAMGLSEESQRTLRVAGLLHDVGKIGVPDRVLRKPGRLDEDELAFVQQHVTLGKMIINEVPNLTDVIAAVGSHHERVDGLGYPRGLKNGEIPLLGRIMAVADAYSAMTTDRPYRKGINPDEARAELLRAAGTQLDPDIVRIFLRVLDEKGQSSGEGTEIHVA
ncbi:MAG: diguanylate cyclase [Chloroflexota bacterium]|nr:MAG: diguanylate cyclase [Chloroflexota bacterium]